MNIYYIELAERRSCLVKVKASSYEEAAKMVENEYTSCRIRLDNNCFVDDYEFIDATDTRTIDARKGILTPNFELEAFI